MERTKPILEVHQKIRAKHLRRLVKIPRKTDPSLHISFNLRYRDVIEDEDKKKFRSTSLIKLHVPEDITRILKASENMTKKERIKAGIDRLLITNAHLPQPSEDNPVKTKKELRSLFATAHVRPVYGRRCSLLDQEVYGHLKSRGTLIWLSIEDFSSVADEFWGVSTSNKPPEQEIRMIFYLRVGFF